MARLEKFEWDSLTVGFKVFDEDGTTLKNLTGYTVDAWAELEVSDARITASVSIPDMTQAQGSYKFPSGSFLNSIGIHRVFLHIHQADDSDTFEMPEVMIKKP